MMLTGMHVAIIGGDARQLEVIRKLVELDAKLSLVGFDQLAHHFTGAVKLPIDEVDFADLDAIILPVHGTTLDGNVNSVFSQEPIPFTEEMVQKTMKRCTIYSGISNSYLDDLVRKTGRKHVQLFERDDVAIYNSIPTAEGTIMMVIQHTDFTIHGSHVAVLGLGRVGMTVARTFAALGAKVKVGARRSEHLARITEMGLVPFHLNDLEKEVRDIDICINTIPHLIVTASVIAKMPAHTLIIDLASKPGGTDFRYAEKRGVKAILAPGLPGVVAPKTAGQIIANVLAQLLYQDLQKREENK
ncbi:MULTISPECIES: dipicolinic acid synthetase subunit A [Geobacillus]|jgi:dipicolinate synthase subunit A|uniref:Dipicolinate synthase, A chain n=2 Tax=Geobacillus thermodenitrificans TaxID=33940 RepID=A4IME7_GEOTN|nr:MULTISPECIES: dipicolinic acid synthetase subunit A [Geobacillus]ABO66501.1 Dipicolinate synthase, A chain [Geobacillus thermodenitrificans NG80-2]ARP42260.1 bifunctional 3-dehydroquinate dehydratase/shikimate dehydrogenase protein [Geobacillus thermodenitrificans]ATO36399.1 dipicolinic acid synthetase subunit A [Geobacillus thermodenitrificans]KQB93897.1 Dipicolinate synthase subunit A [Geobacillus sp. PA-3]MEC5188631.1 dipicolinate synthase subunit A [Geobacillus thermodenitrificans]